MIWPILRDGWELVGYHDPWKAVKMIRVERAIPGSSDGFPEGFWKEGPMI